MVRICSTHGKKMIACRVSVRKPEGKKPIKRYRCRRKNNIKVDIKIVRGEWTALIWFSIAAVGGILPIW
jgi:hypothetical protein